MSAQFIEGLEMKVCPVHCRSRKYRHVITDCCNTNLWKTQFSISLWHRHRYHIFAAAFDIRYPIHLSVHWSIIFLQNRSIGWISFFLSIAAVGQITDRKLRRAAHLGVIATLKMFLALKNKTNASTTSKDLYAAIYIQFCFWVLLYFKVGYRYYRLSWRFTEVG